MQCIPTTTGSAGSGMHETLQASSHAKDFTEHHPASHTPHISRLSAPNHRLKYQLQYLLPHPSSPSSSYLILLHSSAGSCRSLTVHEGFFFSFSFAPSPAAAAACASARASCCLAAIVRSKP